MRGRNCREKHGVGSTCRGTGGREKQGGLASAGIGGKGEEVLRPADTFDGCEH